MNSYPNGVLVAWSIAKRYELLAKLLRIILCVPFMQSSYGLALQPLPQRGISCMVYQLC